MPVDRRRSPRVEILGRLHGQVVSIETPVTVREMSLGGLSFEAEMPFPIGAVHDFRLTLGDGSFVILKGRVVRCVAGLGSDGARVHVTGIQFIDDEPDSGSHRLGDLIDKIR